MTVRTLTQPDNSTQTGAQYKGAIDDAVNVLAQIGGLFAPHAKTVPDLTVLVDAGRLFAAGAIATQNQQTVSGFRGRRVDATHRPHRAGPDDGRGLPRGWRRVRLAGGAGRSRRQDTDARRSARSPPSTTAIANTMITDERSGVAPAFGNLAFPATQVPSSDPNTLDDYEEGSWTPTLGGTTTYGIRTGTYTKIGRVVHAHLNDFAITTLGTGSATQVDGLPFAVNIANGSGTFAPSSSGTCASAIVSATGEAGGSSTIIQMRSRLAAAASDGANNFFGNSTTLRGLITYYV
jgi:hypothetical protein